MNWQTTLPLTNEVKESFRWLVRVGLVEESQCFQRIGVDPCRSRFVVLQNYESLK